MRPLPVLVLLALASCGQRGDEAAQRITLEEVAYGPAAMQSSPDTNGAAWQGAGGGPAIRFGKPGAPPLLTMACAQGHIRITRHAPADPGAKALLALIGNSRIARIHSDAKDGEWFSALPADDPALAVFSGTGAIEATWPGAGTLNLAASPLASALVARCRKPSPPA